MAKGACFFLKKPITPKNLKNVWQHVYRKTRMMGIKSSDCEEAESHGAKAGKRGEVVHVGNERYGESSRAGNSRRKRPASSENDEAREIKRRKLAESENHELADSPTIWLG